ncbi:Gfo/Idh/MocA family protein [Halocatena pleomorpha]|uniref:Gfo/Idh/MocA family oxidoreductase n=1 Tax=Halocatena pleomorpha TaxID=1785090 RepID=A0A3P3RKL1_9EURY|nr:Gfo/Idh/MocA family oxidoreductase [Halocatena pleomorpha]RRJ33438.1 gfo/Idh/MocA family oxidoreductase [Halocatena pleomorpha]
MEFGVISTAGIAQKSVIPAIRKSAHHLRGIASRSENAAQVTADAFDIPQWYPSYEALVDDDRLDAVYIPLPNALHATWVKRAADAGLHVLCEKPLAVDADACRELRQYCADRDVSLMEGFMYRFHPRTQRAFELVDSSLGRLTSFRSSFKFPLRGRPDDIRLDPQLAGGSLMDVGCYPVNAARLFLGEPAAVTGVLHDARDAGVDTSMTALLEYESGLCATVESSFDTQMDQYYRIEAENGWVETHTAFDIDSTEAATLEYVIDGRRGTERFDPVDQYEREINHFARCVADGRTPETDARDAARNMAVLDAIVRSSESNERIEL